MGKAVDPGGLLPPGAPALAELVDRVHAISLHTECVLWDHPHVRERMALRDKSMREVLETLRRGTGFRGPILDRAVQATTVIVVTVF